MRRHVGGGVLCRAHHCRGGQYAHRIHNHGGAVHPNVASLGHRPMRFAFAVEAVRQRVLPGMLPRPMVVLSESEPNLQYTFG